MNSVNPLLLVLILWALPISIDPYAELPQALVTDHEVYLLESEPCKSPKDFGPVNGYNVIKHIALKFKYF